MTTSDLTIDSNKIDPEPEIQPETYKSHAPNIPSKDTNSVDAVATNTESISERLRALTVSIREKLSPGVDKSLQAELATLLNLMHEIDNSYYEHFTPLLEIAIQSLLSEKPNLPLAQGIRKGIEENVHRSPLATIVRGGSPPTRVIRGLGTLLFIVIPLLLTVMVLSPFITRLFAGYGVTLGLGPDTKLILLVAIVGAVGSAISIMVRIQNFESLKNTDPTILFLVGLFKPIIGVVFALFVLAVLRSSVLPVKIDTTNEYYFFAALAFVSGFSERFAQDMVTRAEETFAADQSATPESS